MNFMDKAKDFLEEKVLHGTESGFVKSVMAIGAYSFAEWLDDKLRNDSPWRPASDPPEETEWVLVDCDGAMRCVVWNSDTKQWEDWDETGIFLDDIKWWMPFPKNPAKEEWYASPGHRSN